MRHLAHHRFAPPQRIEARQAKEAAKKAVGLGAAHELATFTRAYAKITYVLVARLTRRLKNSKLKSKRSEMCEAIQHPSHPAPTHALLDCRRPP